MAELTEHLQTEALVVLFQGVAEPLQEDLLQVQALQQVGDWEISSGNKRTT